MRDRSAFSSLRSRRCSNSATSMASRSETASRKCSFDRKTASFVLPTRPDGTDLLRRQKSCFRSSTWRMLGRACQYRFGFFLITPEWSYLLFVESAREPLTCFGMVWPYRRDEVAVSDAICTVYYSKSDRRNEKAIRKANFVHTYVKNGEPPSIPGSSSLPGGLRKISTS